MDQDTIGAHCQVALCRQRDFLPFKCSSEFGGCGGVFCLEHRREHGCPRAGTMDRHAVVCPLCAKTIHFTGAEDVQAQFDAHCRSDCNPETRAERTKKKRCTAAGCKEKLTSSNTVVCSACRNSFCLSHRHGDSHACPGRVGAAGSLLSRAWTAASSAVTGIGATGGAGSRPAPLSATELLKRSAAARMQGGAAPSPPAAAPRPSSATAAAAPASGAAGWSPAASSAPFPPSSSATSKPAASAGVASTSPAVAASAPATRVSPASAASVPVAAPAASADAFETCPVCRAQLSSVMALIEHSERLHATGTAAAPIATTFGLPQLGGAAPARQAPPVDLSSWPMGFGPAVPAAPAAAPHRRVSPLQAAPVPLSDGPEGCPQCGAGFADVGLLIAHVEGGACPRSASSATAATGRAGPAGFAAPQAGQHEPGAGEDGSCRVM